jgi:hypothetical protein
MDLAPPMKKKIETTKNVCIIFNLGYNGSMDKRFHDIHK